MHPFYMRRKEKGEGEGLEGVHAKAIHMHPFYMRRKEKGEGEGLEGVHAKAVHGYVRVPHV